MAKRDDATIGIYNASKQTIPLQAKPPNGDFFLHEQQIRIPKGKTVYIQSSYLLADQVKNLQAKGIIKVIYNSDKK